MIAGSLEIQMLANMAELRKQMDQGVGIVQGAAAQMQKAASLAGKALGLIGVGLSVGAFTGFIRNAIDAADALDEMSGRVGVSAKELSGLQLAYKQAGLGNEVMAASITKLSQEMSEGNAGLRALGVNARDATGQLKSPTAVLLELSDKFAALEDGAGKTALAIEIFGKSGAEMVPLLNSGSDGIGELIAMSERLGLVIEDETAAQAGQFNDTLELLGLGVQGVGSRIAAQLLPTLTNLTGSFLESMTQGDRLSRTADILSAAMKGLYTIGVGVVEMFSTLGKAAGGGIGAIMAMLQGDFAGAKRILGEAKTDILGGWSDTAKAISQAWSNESNAAVAASANVLKANGDLLAGQKAREEAAKRSAAAAAKEAAEQAKRVQEGAKLAASLLAQETGLAPDFAEKWGKMNAAFEGGAIALDELTAAQKRLLAEQPAMKQAVEEVRKAVEASAAARNAEAAGIQAFMQAERQAAAQALAGVATRIRSLHDEEAAARLSREQNISLAQAVELVAIARLREAQATKYHEGSERWKELQAEIDLRTQLAESIGMQGTRQQEAQGWADMWASVDRTAHDTFVNIFEGGSNVFKKLGQTLKASVLDVLYQMTVRKWIINIGTSVFGGGFGAAANAASGGTGVLSSLGSIGSGYSMLAGLGGAFGGGLAGGFGGLLGSLGLSATGTTLGGSLSAGAIALQSGNIMGGLGTLAGALGPLALGVGALVSLLGKDDSGTMHTGALSQYSAAGGLQNSTTHGAFGMGFGGVDYSAETEKFTGSLAQSIVQMLDSTATTFGKNAGYLAATAFADDSSKDGSWGGLLISKLEETIVNWDTDRTSKWAPRELADGEAGQKEYLSLVASDVRAELERVVDGWAKPLLSALGDGATLEQLADTVDKINAAKAAFVSFGQFMPAFAGLADSALDRLVSASGGVDSLTANMSSFVAGFYTDAERLDIASQNLTAEFAKLGLAVPRTTAEYRDLVQAQLALGDAGASTVAQLLAMSGAFLEIAGAANQVQNSLGMTSDTLQSILETAVKDSRSPNEASQMASAAFEQQLMDGMFSALTGSISQMLMTSIVGPLVSGLATGASTASAALVSGSAAAAGGLASGGVAAGMASAQGGGMAANAMAQGGAAAAAAMAQGGAIAGANVQAAIASAHASISAYAAIMSDPSIQEAIKGVSGAIGSVAGELKQRAGLFVTDASFSLGAATGLSSAMGQAADSMKSLTDAIVAEVKRIRGAIVDEAPGAGSYLLAQSEFAIATAAARAGDRKAAEKLPELSRALLELAESQARSSAELRYIQATTAASLVGTAEALVKKFGGKLPAFASGGWHSGGWAMFGEQGPELAYAPPAQVYSAPRTASMLEAGNAAAAESGRDAAQANSVLKDIERNTRRINTTLSDWQRDGVPVKNHEGTTLATKEAEA